MKRHVAVRMPDSLRKEREKALLGHPSAAAVAADIGATILVAMIEVVDESSISHTVIGVDYPDGVIEGVWEIEVRHVASNRHKARADG